MINRSRLSKAAASARTRLLDRMLTHAEEAHLGMEGAPPERTIYRSMFLATGMHMESGEGKFVFGPPSNDDPYRWRPVWKHIEERLACDELVSYAALMTDLDRPPYGLRAGPGSTCNRGLRYRVKGSRRDHGAKQLPARVVRSAFCAFGQVRPVTSPFDHCIRDPSKRTSCAALASRLTAIGESRPTIAAIAERSSSDGTTRCPHSH